MLCVPRKGEILSSLWKKVSLVPLHETFMSRSTRVNSNVFGVGNCKIQPRDWPWVSRVEGRFFHHRATREAHNEEPHISPPQFCKDAVLSTRNRGSTDWQEIQVWFSFALRASGPVKGFSWGGLNPRVHTCAFCPAGLVLFHLEQTEVFRCSDGQLPTSTSLNTPTSANNTTSEHNF